MSAKSSPSKVSPEIRDSGKTVCEKSVNAERIAFPVGDEESIGLDISRLALREQFVEAMYLAFSLGLHITIHSAPQSHVQAAAGDGHESWRAVQLSPSQRDVLQLYARGVSMSIIAEQFGVGTCSIQTHIKRIRAKLRDAGAPHSGRTALFEFARHLGLV
ncbi:MAG: response regulator transcription factor [Actinomycetes bacterium]